MRGYDTAQICLNGHVINDSIRTSPEFNKDYCDKCGSATITTCQECKSDIQGYYNHEGVFISLLETMAAPSFCHKCGKPYPWTEAKLKAAHDLAQELEDISEEEKKILSKSIDDIIKDTPLTTVATTRFKKILSKTGKSTVDAFRDLLIDIASETAKKMLWPE